MRQLPICERGRVLGPGDCLSGSVGAGSWICCGKEEGAGNQVTDSPCRCRCAMHHKIGQGLKS